MTSENCLSILRDFITANEPSAAIKYCEENQSRINENAFDVLPAILEHINENNHVLNANVFQAAAEVFAHICKHCHYEDVVLSLHKELTDVDDDQRFLHLLPPLKIALLQLPIAKFKYAAWCFNAIQTFVNGLPAPEIDGLEEEEVQTRQDAAADQERLIVIYESIFAFYEPLILEFRTENESLIIVKHCLQLFGPPWAFLSMTENDNNTPNVCRTLSEDFIAIIAKVHQPLKFLHWLKYRKAHDEDVEVRRLALAHFFYFIFGERCQWHRVPQVYAAEYIFRHAMYFISELFTRESNTIIEKGLRFGRSVFNARNINCSLLDDPIHSLFVEALSRVIAHSEIKHQRQQALALFRNYVLCFDARGRYMLIFNAFKSIPHTGIMGYLITLYKDLLVDEFRTQELGQYFSGGKFTSLLMMFCQVPGVDYVKIVEWADEIIPTLNLLRYLFIRDKNNQTGVKSLLNTLRRTYFEPLKNGVLASREHCEAVMAVIQKEQQSASPDDMEANMSVTLKGDQLPHLSVDDKIHSMKGFVTAMDVIESVLARLLTCID